MASFLWPVALLFFGFQTGNPAADSGILWSSRFPTIRNFFIDTNLFASPQGTTCKSSNDCTETCQQSCQKALIDNICVRNCSDHCTVKECDYSVELPENKKNCRFACSGACLPHCRQQQLQELHRKLRSCADSKALSCKEACELSSAEEQQETQPREACQALCEGEDQMLLWEARCLKAKAVSCINSCGQHVCVGGLCRCPVWSAGDSQCTRHASAARDSAPPDSRFCYQSFFNHTFLRSSDGELAKAYKFKDSILHGGTRQGRDAVGLSVQLAASQGGGPHPAPDLRQLAEWSSCAVVSGGRGLLGSGFGAEIDNHTAVVRFNDAPTSGYEADVGSKTTLRIQNNRHCGFCEQAHELLLPYTEMSVSERCYSRGDNPQCQVLRGSRSLVNFVERFFEEHPKFQEEAAARRTSAAVDPTGDIQVRRRLAAAAQDAGAMRGSRSAVKGIKKVSAGLFGAIVAMHLCGSVDLYGFTQSDQHYYDKVMRTDRNWTTFHLWELERHCLRSYASVVPGVEAHEPRRNAFDALIADEIGQV